MAKVNSLLTQRLKQATEKLSKMTNLAEMSSTGNLSSFSGVFRVTQLSSKEQEILQEILTHYSDEKKDIRDDLESLMSITSEVKAINNQAAILHGERIKKAQGILKQYRDGAFSAWLIATYGNRQTPYNFLQYYELYMALPQMLHPKLDEMPRQAVYTLASRSGEFEKKEEIVKNYKGEPKQVLLSLIRKAFPLSNDDRRATNLAEQAIQALDRIVPILQHHDFRPSLKQKEHIKELLKTLQTFL
ncbi:MAG TPA: CT583 family protein [Rhabdochlamydiaceae bacterium]|nr:CT583 family protein [Rhabdochlamydiaceae bacterium]